ncbi:maleylpyruvate isomerase N-terminal domain-containing protein [Okibacterium endophyticum]
MVTADRFARASETFCTVVRAITPDQWEWNALGVWDVRSLVGHTARALITVIDYLELDPAERADMPTAGDYYGQIYLVYTNPEAIAKRGVEAGEALRDDPVGGIERLRSRALQLIDAQDASRLVSLGGMGIPLDEYLRTRVFELVVHTLDIARATGQHPQFGPDLIEETAALAAGIAARTGRGEQVILALTGREDLPQGFTVV